jgi:hypothetical protein
MPSRLNLIHPAQEPSETKNRMEINVVKSLTEAAGISDCRLGRWLRLGAVVSPAAGVAGGEYFNIKSISYKCSLDMSYETSIVC